MHKEQAALLSLLPDNSPVVQLLNYYQAPWEEELFQKKYAALVAENNSETCFLSILIRTQGTRIQMLQDVLLCLAAQTDTDFEVLLLLHRAERTAQQKVQALIDSFTDELQCRICCIPTEEGQRGAPINLGMALARGRYAVCLDDDDLVLDNWVETFHETEKQHPGEILHAYVLVQPWHAVSRGEATWLQASGSPDARYCIPFNHLKQQTVNRCPFMGLAFPLYLFRQLHLLVNEELTTTEDWDYLLRTATLCGVTDIKTPTAIYRLWDSVDASRSLHQRPEWLRNYRSVLGESRKHPLLLPAKDAKSLRLDASGEMDDDGEDRAAFLQEAILFYSASGDFSDRDSISAPLHFRQGGYTATFAPDSFPEGLTRLRLDPAEEGLFVLSSVDIVLSFADGTVKDMSLDDCLEHNGQQQGQAVLFLTNDPCLVFQVSEDRKLQQVTVSFKVSFTCPAPLRRMAEAQAADMRWRTENRHTARLFVDTGCGFSDSQVTACSHVLKEDGSYLAEWTDVEPGTRAIRVDPSESGLLCLENWQLVLHGDGFIHTVTTDEIGYCTGFTSGTALVFLADDPYMSLTVKANVQEITLSGQYHFMNAQESQRRFAQAERVWDYRSVIDQLRQVRQSMPTSSGEEDDSNTNDQADNR